ncbi:Rnase E [Gordonia phage Clawz]|uniref:Uncharacterized protein n=1 Tax=Gordonia phage Clawz TaxID=2743910 RepID=A0AAE7F8T9_9CAUD|nr:Rnase E [Gordonia phage Clawz]QKY79934.1 hypothetical protein SEA_CLAWZ_22 [Gordonia phage Clawz]
MAKAGGGPGRPRSVAAQAKAKKASEMRIAGMTWDQIAEEVGYKTESGARLAVRRYFERGAHDVFDRMHPVLNGRAELLWRKAWARVNRATSTDEWDKAMRQCINIVMMQARMNGCLDQKVQVEVSTRQEQSVRELQEQFHKLTLIEGGYSDGPGKRAAGGA